MHLEACVDPGSQAIPAGLAGLGRQIGQDQPGVGIALFPAGQQGAPQPSLRALEGRASAPPARARLRHEAGQRAVGGLWVGPKRAAAVDAQERMPAQPDDAPKQPASIQPAIGQHDDRPGPGNGRPQLAQHPQPLAAPGMGLVGRQDGPGHRDGTAAIHHTDGQHREAGAQGRGIEGQGQLRALPVVQHPAQQGHKAVFHGEGLAMGAPFGFGFVAPLTQLLPHGLLLTVQPGGQQRADSGQGARAR